MLGTTIDPAQGASRAPHLAALTGLRFMAAANVLAFHYAPHPSFIDLSNIPMLVYLTVLSGGASSVSLFFVLSGFVLAHRYIGDDGTFRGQRARFWLARVRRIAPAYFLAYVLALSWMALHGGTDPLAALATLGMVQAWWAPLARIVNNPAWSLSVEVFLYATFPLLAPPVYRWAQKRPAAVVAALLLVCCLVRISGTLPGPLVRDGALAPWFALLILRLARGRSSRLAGDGRAG